MNALVPVIAERFRKHFPGKPLLVVSPGRVNLIGEHTDYNEGFVMPGATDKAVVFAVAPRADRLCHFVSRDFDQEFRCELGEFHRSPLRWPDYLLGVLDQFVKAGHRVGGISCVFGGDIPIGAGMSSSAAIEGGLAFALNALFGLGLDSLTLVKLAQKAENEFVGVRCGIMDQFINIHGRAKTVLKLDCRSLDVRIHPLRARGPSRRHLRHPGPPRAGLVGIQRPPRPVRGRRQRPPDARPVHPFACGTSAWTFSASTVRSSTRSSFDAANTSSARTSASARPAAALARNDFGVFGGLMNLSHAGLRDDYEVSSAELDALVEAARRVPGVLGSRMMGAGFGGCTISLVEAGAVPDFEARVSRDYEAVTGRAPKIHVIRIEAGTHAVDLA